MRRGPASVHQHACAGLPHTPVFWLPRAGRAAMSWPWATPRGASCCGMGCRMRCRLAWRLSAAPSTQKPQTMRSSRWMRGPPCTGTQSPCAAWPSPQTTPTCCQVRCLLPGRVATGFWAAGPPTSTLQHSHATCHLQAATRACWLFGTSPAAGGATCHASVRNA